MKAEESEQSRIKEPFFESYYLFPQRAKCTNQRANITFCISLLKLPWQNTRDWGTNRNNRSTFFFLQFWRLEVQDQGNAKVGF